MFLHSYEAEFIERLLKINNKKLAVSFNLSFRYIDDVLSLNNSKFGDYVNVIYPKELELKDTTDKPTQASYLDLHLEIDNRGRLSTKLFDKRDDFSFAIINFPLLGGDIPAAPAYGVYISQLVRYSRACDLYKDFLDRARILTGKLFKQGFVAERLKSSLQNFFGRHHELVNLYESICVANAYRLVSINNFVLPSAPDLTMAIMAGVSRDAVDAHSAGTPGLTLVFMGP